MKLAAGIGNNAVRFGVSGGAGEQPGNRMAQYEIKLPASWLAWGPANNLCADGHVFTYGSNNTIRKRLKKEIEK